MPKQPQPTRDDDDGGDDGDYNDDNDAHDAATTARYSACRLRQWAILIDVDVDDSQLRKRWLSSSDPCHCWSS